MSNESWVERPYRQDNLQRIAAFLRTGPERLQSEYTALATDPTQQVRLWEDPTGDLLAYAHLRVGGEGAEKDMYLPALFFRLRPDVRATFPRGPIFDWALAQVDREAATRGLVRRLNVGANPDNETYQQWLEARGFRRVSTMYRAFYDMTRALPVPLLPPGYSLRSFGGGTDVEPFVTLFNDAVGFPWTVEQQRAMMAEADYVPELNLIALAPDGDFAGLCICHVMDEWSKQSGQVEGSLSELALRAGYPRELKQPLLIEGLRRLQAKGVSRARRFVIATQETDLSLYRKLGFTVERKTLFYRKEF